MKVTMSSMIILRNRVKCTKCNDIIESEYTHNYVECGCGTIMTDGGKDYIRRSYTGFEENMDVIIPSFDDKSVDTTEALWYDFLRFFDTNSGVAPTEDINEYKDYWPEDAGLGHPAVLCLNFIVRNRERISDLIEKGKLDDK